MFFKKILLGCVFFLQGCLSFGSNFCFGRDNLAFPTCAEKPMEPVISPIDFLSGFGWTKGAGYSARAAARVLARKKFVENGEIAGGYIKIFCEGIIQSNLEFLAQTDLDTYSIAHLKAVEQTMKEVIAMFPKFRADAIAQIERYSIPNSAELLSLIDELISTTNAALLRLQRAIIENARSQIRLIN